MTRNTVFSFFSLAAAVFAVCALSSCAPSADSDAEAGDAENWWEESEPPDPADYGIDLNAINKKETVPAGAAYQNNPLLGYEWQPGSSGGFTYFFKRDGTVSSTHHCELLFDNQFSYAVYRNFLVTYGQEMTSGERLEAWTLHRAGNNGEIVLFKRNPATGAALGYDVYSPGAADSSPAKGTTSGAPASPPYTPFLGSWTGSDGASYMFRDDGGYTATLRGETSEHIYLVRGGKLAAFTQGEVETVNGGLQWKSLPVAAREYTFTLSGGGAIVLSSPSGNLTLNKNKQK